MKYSYISILSVVVFLGACSEPELTLEEKKAKIVELRNESAKLNAEIATLEAAVNKEVKASDITANYKRIEALELKASTFAHYIEVPGNVDSERNVQVNPEMGGVIVKKMVEEGQEVREGQAMFEIDSDMIRKQSQELKTRLELATTIYERQANLWKQKIGSEIQYLQAKNNKEALEQSIKTVNTQLEKTIIRSPIAGTVDEIYVNMGEMANPAMPVARVVNLTKVEITAEVSESYVKDVKAGDEVSVFFSAIGQEMKSPIRSVGQFINPQNRTFSIQMKLANPDKILKPNTMATVKIKDFEMKDAVSVPANLIQKSTDGQFFLYTVVSENGNDVVKKVVIETSKSYQGQTLVTKGLKPGDKVIVKGYNDVINDEKVILLPSSSSI